MRHETELRTPTIDKHSFTLCIIRPLLTVTIPFDEELTLETTALKLFTVANLHYFFTTSTQNSLETHPLIRYCQTLVQYLQFNFFILTTFTPVANVSLRFFNSNKTFIRSTVRITHHYMSRKLA